jgi:glycosyltransferase involved in cell wall biosynthesis
MHIPSTNTAAVKDTAPAKTPIKVCMHVLRSARDDPRLIRSGTALVKEGFDVSVVDLEQDRSRSTREDIHGVYVKHLIVPGWRSSRRSEFLFFITALRTFILSLLRLMRSDADIYHAIELNTVPACCIAAALRRKPLVYEAYELNIPFPETRVVFWRRLAKLLMGFLALVLPRCAAVITTTPLYAQEIQKHFHLKEVSLVRNIPPYTVVQKNDRLRQYLGLSPETRIALYQGGLQRNRRLDMLVRAARFLGENIIIVLMGPGERATIKELGELILTEGVADRVKIIPPVPYEELLTWTASADLGLIVYSPDYAPAIRMCLPNKLFEFLMAGLPVLASQLDAVIDIIRTYDVGQVMSSLAPTDIAEAIDSMLADSDALARMRCNALKVAKQDLNWEQESQQLTGLYHLILTRQKQKKEKRM